MKINPQTHDAYNEHVFTWERVEDCYLGQDQLMRNIHKYFACPVGLHSDELKNSEAYDKAVEYMTTRVAYGSGYCSAAKAYYSNAIFPALTSYTINGFMSLISEHDPIVELPDEMSYFYVKEGLENDDKAFSKALQNQINVNVLKSGRCPVLLDPQQSADGKPVFVVYDAKAAKNWVVSNEEENRGTLLEVLLLEYLANEEYSSVSTETKRSRKRYLHLRLVNGVYTVDTYTETADDDYTKTTVVPNVRGKTLNYIPLVFIGSEDNTPDIDVAPLSGIAVNQVKYGQLEALLAHSENHSGAPTFVVSGVDPESMPKVTGAGVGIALPDYTSKAYYTTTDTSFMQSIRERQSEFLAQAQDQGANLLGSAKNTSESGEALRLRQAASTATLKSIIGNVGRGIEQLLRMAADWMGLDKSVVKYTPNQEFSTFALTANEQIALVQSWQAGAISHSTLLENFRKSGMLKPGENIQNELDTLLRPGEKYVDPNAESTTDVNNELNVGEDLQKANTLNKAIKS